MLEMLSRIDQASLFTPGGKELKPDRQAGGMQPDG